MTDTVTDARDSAVEQKTDTNPLPTSSLLHCRGVDNKERNSFEYTGDHVEISK